MAVIKVNPKTDIAALIVGAFASAIVVVIALTIKDEYDKITIDNGKNGETSKITKRTTWKSVLITFTLTFIAYTIAYLFLYYMFGYRLV